MRQNPDPRTAQVLRSPSSIGAALRHMAPLKRKEGLIGLLLLALILSYYLFDYDRTVSQFIDRASERTLAAFALARGINAVISVIQEIEIGFTLGVSANISPGQILDPVNDLIERFSLVMLVAATVFWIMRLAGSLLYGPDTLWLMGLLFAAGLLLVRSRHAALGTLGELLQRLTSILMMLLVFVVTTPLLVEIVHESDLIRSQYDATSRELSEAKGKLEEMNLEIESSIGEKVNRYIEQAETIADDISRQVVIQIAVFVLETLLIPLACLWITASLISREYKAQLSPG